MPKLLVTTKGEVQETWIEDKPGGLTVILHYQGIRVDVPDFVEINPRNTIACMEKMTQQEWEWISNGELFQTLFKMYFDARQFCEIEIPQTISELNAGDMGVIHVAGMIVLGCEAIFAKQNVFYRNPETYLHPATELMIMDTFRKMLEMTGNHGGVAKVELDPENIKKEIEPQTNETPIEDKDWEQTLTWLKLMPEKPFAKIGETTYTTTDLILEVANKSDVGKMMVEKFVSMRYQ